MHYSTFKDVPCLHYAPQPENIMLFLQTGPQIHMIIAMLLKICYPLYETFFMRLMNNIMLIYKRENVT